MVKVRKSFGVWMLYIFSAEFRRQYKKSINAVDKAIEDFQTAIDTKSLLHLTLPVQDPVKWNQDEQAWVAVIPPFREFIIEPGQKVVFMQGRGGKEDEHAVVVRKSSIADEYIVRFDIDKS